MLVTDVLQELGYAALGAANATTGLAILQSDKRIDLLITDVGLPGMNSRHLADAAHRARAAPGVQLLTKSFTMQTLGGRIGEIIKDAG